MFGCSPGPGLNRTLVLNGVTPSCGCSWFLLMVGAFYPCWDWLDKPRTAGSGGNTTFAWLIGNSTEGFWEKGETSPSDKHTFSL